MISPLSPSVLRVGHGISLLPFSFAFHLPFSIGTPIRTATAISPSPLTFIPTTLIPLSNNAFLDIADPSSTSSETVSSYPQHEERKLA